MELFKEFLKKTGIGLKEYIKSELITSAICFALLLFGLYIGNVPYFGLVAFAIAVIDMLPVLGSGIILIPWSIIAFVQTNHKLAYIYLIVCDWTSTSTINLWKECGFKTYLYPAYHNYIHDYIFTCPWSNNRIYNFNYNSCDNRYKKLP